MRTSVWTVSVLTALILTTACSRIKSYFPDKEKDYQFTTEIPPLQLPPDLQHNAVNYKPVIEPGQSRPVPAENAPVRDHSLELPWQEVATAPKFIPVELVDYDGGATRLRIEEPVSRAWRYVGKALSRHSIEIVARNEKEHFYIVQYDPDAQKVKDGAIWDELVFFFGEDPIQEKELRIRMAEKNPQLTEVIVLDRNDKPLSKGVGLQLLNLLKNTINEDLADKTREESDQP